MEDETVPINGGNSPPPPPPLSGVSGDSTPENDAQAERGEEEEGLRLKRKVESLEAEIRALMSERADLSRRLEEAEAEIDRAGEDRRALAAVADRAAKLEGEITQVQNELNATISDSEDTLAEVQRLRQVVKQLEGEKIATEASRADLERKLSAAEEEAAARVSERDAEIRRLEEELSSSEERGKSLEAQREEAISKVSERDAEITDLEGKVASLEWEVKRVSQEKSEELDKTMKKLKAANTDLEEKVATYAIKLEKVREMENGIKIVGGAVNDRDGMIKFPWAVVAASAGAVTVAAVTCYLHYHARKR